MAPAPVPSEDSIDLSSAPQDLFALLGQMRSIYQASLLAGTEARKDLEAEVAEARRRIEDESNRFRPDPKVLARLEAAWTNYGTGEPVIGEMAVAEGLPKNLSALIGIWDESVAEAERMRSDVLFRREGVARENSRIFRRKQPLPRLPAGFRESCQMLRAVMEGFEPARQQYLTDGQTAVAELRGAFKLAAGERQAALDRQLKERAATVEMATQLLGESGQDWISRLAESPQFPTLLTAATRLGAMRSGIPAPNDLTAPCVLSFPDQRGLAIQAPTEGTAAHELMRSVLLRVLLGAPSGRVRLSLIDPTAMGQTFAELLHLADFDEQLVDVGVKTSAQAIERCLTEHVAGIETVISKYLRGQFQNIHDYNRQAGEMAEPCRIIAVADYPTQMTDRSRELLLSLVENGPRCGTYVVLLHRADDPEARGVPLSRLTATMDRISFTGSTARLALIGSPTSIEFQPDACPPITFDATARPTSRAATYLEAVGRGAQRSADVVVTLDNFLPALARSRAGVMPDRPDGAPTLTKDPATWWTATTADTAVAPIGRTGAQGVASMFFSSTTVAGGAIVVGLPRSGKTTALHALVLGMSMLYSPEELELFLIDAKHGVEFKAYERLPHARMVSIHSDREFSVAVLKSLQATIRERAELLKRHGQGLSNITQYRAVTGDRVPRIVVVIDEFHELFEEADTLGNEAFAAFSDIVRMGPFSGVHMVVASQTLSSMPAMDRQTLTLLPQRIAFMCNEYDAEIVMGDGNRAPRLLSKTGEGLFNPARGDESKNQPFQGLYVPPEERADLVCAAEEKARMAGWTRRPRVFDGDAVVARPTGARASRPTSRFSADIGEPLSLAEAESLTLPHSRGANVLLISGRTDSGADPSSRGFLHSVLSAGQQQGAPMSVIDFAGEEPEDGGLSTMDAAERFGARYVRSRAADAVLAETDELVIRRAESEDYRSPTELLLLVGLQRAMSFRPVDPYDGDTDLAPTALLTRILRDGPEVGVHTLLEVDRAWSLEARLGAGVLDEISIRVAASGAEPKDLELLSSGYGAMPPVRYGQLLLADVAQGRAIRVRAYDVVRPESTPESTEQSIEQKEMTDGL